MGVLKVWDSSTSTWRKVGCGGTAAPSSFTDNFNRADNSGSLGTGWTALAGTWGISGNAATLVTPVGASSDNFAVYDTALADCSFSVKLADVTNLGYGMGVCFRATDASNLYIARLQSGSADILKVEGGSFSNVSPANPIGSTVSGDVVTVVLSGSSASLYLNGTLVVSTYVPITFNQTATKHGLWGTTVSGGSAVVPGASKWDDFTATPPGVATTGRLRMQLPDGSWVREACDTDTGVGPNLLTSNQAGFELGTTTGWAVPGGFDAVLTAVTTPTPAAGSFCMAIEHTSTTGALPFATPTGTAGMAVSPSAAYSITAQFRTSSGGTLNCKASWYDSAGTLIVANVLGEIPWSANDTWVAQAWTDTALAGAAFLSIEFTVEHIDVNAKRAWIDDINVHLTSVKHPLKIEDPANPGTWITVACMVPV